VLYAQNGDRTVTIDMLCIALRPNKDVKDGERPRFDEVDETTMKSSRKKLGLIKDSFFLYFHREKDIGHARSRSVCVQMRISQ